MAIDIVINSRVNREIAKAIVAAQVCSDSGKGIDILAIKGRRGPYHMGYGLKDGYILRALKMITTTKNGFSFYVNEKPDQNGYSSVIVYFEYNYGGKHQISFHTPIRKAERLLHYSGKGRKTHWNNAHTSRDDCALLCELFNL